MADIKKEDWEMIKASSGWNEVDLRDNNYNQIVHMVSAADGAEDFYTIQGHGTRLESPEQAREMDVVTANAWVGHPCYDVIDNSTGFEEKIVRMISAVCKRIGVDTGDRLAPNSIKRKFLVTEMAEDKAFPHYEEFTVIRDYLVTPLQSLQPEEWKLPGCGGNYNPFLPGFWSYTHTIRRPEINNQSVELRSQISEKDYEILLAQRDNKHYTLQKQRRCFLWHNQYYQLDIYLEPCPEMCKGLLLLETFTAKDPSELNMPDFLKIDREVTHDPNYTMFKMSLKIGLLETTDDDVFSEED
ncbi:hypothetical protein C0Q70_08457 [Pomacea canaliculata]|uniref:Uncharacterized protein n=1 Tax=Pomacea canaliculata TaxID=400727 RepID=A0A2T7PHW4_POMCA|nr:hypothetical protein C0Q70_08457 [Pomacea canaliculata]